MAEDLKLAGKAPKTVKLYLAGVRGLANHYGCSPNKLSEEQVRQYLLYLIDKRQLKKPLLVRRGEVIRVMARAAGVQVRTTARATEDGAFGDIITVQSLENREKYSAHVTGLQEAEVYATAVPASGTSPRRVSRRPIPKTENR